VIEENAATSAEAQAFKRACSAFGLGRYIYSVPQVWAEYDPQRRQFTSAGDEVRLKALRELVAAYGDKVRKPHVLNDVVVVLERR